MSSKFSEIVNKDYNGDFDEAVRDYLLNKPRGEILPLFDGLSMEEMKRFGKVYREILSHEYPGGVALLDYEDLYCKKLGVSVDELRKCPANPYSAGLKKTLLIAFLTVVGAALAAVAVKAIGIDPAWVITIAGIGLFTEISSGFAGTFIQALRFNRMLDIYKSKEYREKYPEYLKKQEQIDKIRDLLFVNNEELDKRDGYKK